MFAEQVLSLRSHFSSCGWNLLFSGVEFHKLGQVELGFLKDLDFADEDIFEREDLRALLGDGLANLVRQPK